MSDAKRLKSIGIILLLLSTCLLVVFSDVGMTDEHIVVESPGDFGVPGEYPPLGIQGQQGLARTSDGNLHTVYAKQVGGNRDIYYSTSDDDGVTWTETQLTSAGSQNDASIAVDSGDHIYVFWDGIVADFPGRSQIQYRVLNGTWKPAFNLTYNATYDQYEPSIAINSTDAVHIVWMGDSLNSFTIDYAYASVLLGTGELQWSSLFNVTTWVSGIDGGYVMPSLAIDSNDIVHIVWEVGRNLDIDVNPYIEYCSFNGLSFSSIINITTQDGSFTYWDYSPAIVIDSNDYIHLIWMNDTDTVDITIENRTSVDGGLSWGTVMDVATDLDTTAHVISSISFSRSYDGVADTIQAIWATDFFNLTGVENGTIFTYSNYTTSWSTPVDLTAKLTNKSRPCILYAECPVISTVHTNIPTKGFAFVYVNESTNVSYYSSDDLSFPSFGAPPFLSDEHPATVSLAVDVNILQVNVTIIDNEGDTFNWTIDGDNITTNSSLNDDNGIKNASVIGPLGYATVYTWWVNASDGHDGYTNETYTFTTESYAATTLYVDDDYTALTPGWHLTKYDSIIDAMAAIIPGGVIYVYPGQYDGNVVVNKTINLTGVAGSYGSARDSIIVNGTGIGNAISVTANKVNISYLRIQNGNYGIYLNHVNNGSIVGCNVTDNNRDGLYFSYSNDTLIKDNNFSSNTLAGLNITDPMDGSGSFNNLIYHNNFLDNGVNVIGEILNTWNTSYPFGGNYWDDHYWFFDNYSGLAQNYTGSDGISDQEYDISRVTFDFYPLMSPWTLGNHPPYIWNSNPASGAENIPINQANVRITIQDAENNTFIWTLESKYVTAVYVAGATNGIKTVPLNLPLPYFTTITWYVNATDGTSWTRHVFTFETASQFSGTIQAAINAAAPGSTIFVYRGHFVENLVINKAITLVGEEQENATIDAGGAGDAISITSDDVTIRNLTITNSGSNNGPTFDSGVDSRNRDNVTIDDCNVTGNNNGIYFHTITNSNITNGKFSSNQQGIYIVTSESIDIEGNEIYSNFGDGITLDGSDHFYIANNSIYGNGGDGLKTFTICEDNVYTYNIVRLNAGARNILLQDDLRSVVSHNIVSEGGYGIIIYSCNYVTVDYNTVFSGSKSGIELWDHTENTFVRGNNCSGNIDEGIRIYFGSSNNQIYENELHGTDYLHGIPNVQGFGIKIEFAGIDHCQDNFIFHNNLYDNIVQAQDDELPGTNIWNDTYPSGGNYYSNFCLESQGAFDHYQNPNQNVPGADGIVDSHSLNPYNITGTAGSQDWYPLVHPWSQTLQADFDYTPKNPQVNQKISFWDASKGFVVSYAWSFGDGTSATGRSTFHTYRQENFYTVTLQVTDNRGVTAVMSKVISVGSDVISIPPLQPPKYPNTPFTVPEMYELMRADVKSDAKVVIVIIDSGITSRTYSSVDLSKVISMQHPVYYDGKDAFGHGCIDGTSYIYIKDGLIKIRDFYENLKFTPEKTNAGLTKYINTKTISVTNNGTIMNDTIRAVHKVFVEDAIKITTIWNKTLTLTPWHPTPIIYNDSVIWKRADELTTDDYIVCPTETSNFGEYQDIAVERRLTPGPQKISKEIVMLDEDLAWLIGFTIGDGNIRVSRSEVTLNDEKIGTLERAKEIAMAHNYTVGNGIKSNLPHQNGYHLAIYSGFDKLFVALGYNNDNIKNVPEAIFKSPSTVREAFIAGLFDAEGYCWETSIKGRNPGEIRVIVSTNETLCKQTVVVLDSLGIPSSYERILKAGYGGKEGNNTLYAVTIKQKWNLINFRDRIGDYIVTFKKHVIENNIKNNLMFQREVVLLKDCAGLKIRKIEKIKINDFFYDLSTEKYNNYYASGFMVHNTWVNYCVQYGVQTFCPNAVQYSIKAFDDKGTCSPRTFIGALDLAKSLNPDVVTISAGIFGTPTDDYAKKVGELRAAGIIVTVSAGNSGPMASTITSPASGANSIAVGAIDPIQLNGVKSILDLSDDVVCEFSSRGPVEGIAPKPDFTAPGESIIGPWMDGEKVASGTSMSAPFMAASAMEVIGANKQLLGIVRFIYGGKTYTDIIESSFADSAYDKGDQNAYGWGIPNVEVTSRIVWIKAMFALIIFVIALLAIIITFIVVFRVFGKKR